MLNRLSVRRVANPASTSQRDKMMRFLRNATSFTITPTDAPGEILVRDKRNSAIISFVDEGGLMYSGARPGPLDTAKPGLTAPEVADKIAYKVMEALTDYGG